MRLLVGHQDFNIPNGYNSHCDWLKFDGIYEKLSEIAKDEFEVVDVNVNECNDFYFFPINANNRETKIFSEEYFFGKYLSDKVLDDLKNDRCILHFNWIDEPYVFNKEEINRLEDFLFIQNLSWGSIILTSNNFNLKMKRHESFNFFENSIECNTHYLGFKMIGENFDFNEIRHSKFLSMARSGHNHRKSLVDFYEKENYTDEEILYSALWMNKRIDDRFHWPNVHNESELNHGDSEINLSQYEQNPYQNSYISIITETNFDNNALQVTDKVFQPIVNFHPFIYVSSCGGLKLLKSMGYKTFNFIDESYDDIEDETERLNFIKSEIKRLIKLKKSEIHNTYYQIVDVLRYNRKHWLNVGRYRVIKQMEVFYQNIRN
jgi:hypothetical protein